MRASAASGVPSVQSVSVTTGDVVKAVSGSGVLLCGIGLTAYAVAQLQILVTPGWLMLLAMAVTSFGFMLLFAHKQTAYAHEPWWQFALDDRAPRALRPVRHQARPWPRPARSLG